MKSRVALRSLTGDDANWIYEACQDPEIARWTTIPQPYRREHAAEFVVDHAGDVAAWVIVDADTEEPLGVIGIHAVDPTTGLADIGYWVRPHARGRGAASEAVVAVTEEVRSAGVGSPLEAVSALLAFIAPTNIASIRVVEGVGFVPTEPPAGKTCPDGDADLVALAYRIDLGR